MNDLDLYSRLISAYNGDTNTLREVILTLALRGRMVDQKEGDESAEHLLFKAKKLCNKAGRPDHNNKRKRPDFLPLKKSEFPYLLPVGWVWVRLSSVGEINPRNNLHDYTQVGFVPMSLIQDGYVNNHSFQIREWSEVKRGFTHFQDGDVGVAKITPCFENRKSCVFQNLPNGYGAGTTELHIFRNKYNVFDPSYLLLCFKKNSFISNGYKQMTGTAGLKRISRSFFSETAVPLPPLAEQKRIVEKVRKLLQLCNELDEKRDLRRRNIDLAYKTSIKHLLCSTNKDEKSTFWKLISEHFITFHSNKESILELRNLILVLATQGKLVPQDKNDTPVTQLINDIHKLKRSQTSSINKEKRITLVGSQSIDPFYQIPKTWAWIKLGEYTKLTMGQSPPSNSYNEKQYGMPFFQGKRDFGELNPVVRIWCSQPRTIAPADSVLISVRAPVGPTNICTFDACIGRGLAAITCLAGANNKYLLYYLRSIEETIESYGQGSTFKAITKAVLENILVPVPPVEEQERIVNKIEYLFEMCNRIERKIDEKNRIIAELDSVLLKKVVEQ